MNQLVPITDRTPALVATAGERVSYRFFEFFIAQIRNPNTRRANVRAWPCAVAHRRAQVSFQEPSWHDRAKVPRYLRG